MFNHILISQTSTHGPQLKSILNSLKIAKNELPSIIAVMQSMIDGDGSQDAHYVEITARFGTQSDAQSHALFNELNSCNAKLQTDLDVTFVSAAINQLIAKCG